MAPVLDIVPLRSLVAVADCGGFHRAAAVLNLTQAAVSRHVGKLQAAAGTPLVERDGRGIRFTPAGAALVRDARRVLAAHDEAVARLRAPDRPSLTVGIMDHAADELLPALAAALRAALPGHGLHVRTGRSAGLRTALARGGADVAVVFDGLAPRGAPGTVPLRWLAARGRPDARPVPLVLFDDACSLRDAALDGLAAARVAHRVAVRAADLTGVHAAVRAGLGVTLLPGLGALPDGLAPVESLPPVPSALLKVRVRRGLDAGVAARAREALMSVLGGKEGKERVSSRQ